MIFGGEADESDGDLRAVDREAQGGFGRGFIAVGEKRELVFVLWDLTAGEGVHGHYTETGLMCCFHALPSVWEVDYVGTEKDALEFLLLDDVFDL